MSSPERVYALLVEANPIPDPRSVPPVPSLALVDERSSAMHTKEPTTAKPIAPRRRWRRAVGAFAAAVVAAAVGIWVVASDGEPVAAADARIEVTFTGDGTSYVGDREIIEGTADITFVNESDFLAWFNILRFDTGSAELASELELIGEGGSDFTDVPAPSGLEFSQTFAIGTHTVEITLEPGTYIFDTGPEFVTLVNRAAVVEVVAD